MANEFNFSSNGFEDVVTEAKEPKIYTGIGSRKTPKDVMELMTKIAVKMNKEGFQLRSGGADGADTAFEKGAGTDKQVFLPWKGFNHRISPWDCVTEEALKIAKEIHPAWHHCSQGAQKLHGRNVYQVLGFNLKSPANLVIFYAEEAPDGTVKGGTATAVHLARKHQIPTFNLLHPSTRHQIEAWLKE